MTGLLPGDLFVLSPASTGKRWGKTMFNRYFLALEIKQQYASGALWEIWRIDQCRLTELFLYDYDYEIVQRL